MKADTPAQADSGGCRVGPILSSRLRLDDQGRLIPPTDAEHQARAAAALRMIEEVNNIPDEPGEDDGDFFRTIEAERPERPLFEGLY